MFDALAAGVKEVSDIDPDRLNDRALSDAVIEIHRLQAQLDAANTKLLAAWSRRRSWQDDGAKSASAWLAWKTRQPKPQASRQLHHAEALNHMPVAAAAFAAGDITSAHVEQLRKIRTPATEEQFARDEKVLVDQAKTLKFADFAKAARYWYEQADQDGAERAAAKRDSRQRFDLSSSLESMWFGTLILNPIAGTIVSDTLREIEHELYQQEKAEGEITLTNSQRRAAALVEMAIRARRVNPDQVARKPLFSVLVNYETLHGRICELANGMIITPGQLLPWLDQAYLERAVFNPATCHIDDIGERKRLFTGATRRAVELRDHQCDHPSCDEPTERCQIDHKVPWSKLGNTTPDNGQPACGYHNRLKSNNDPDPPPRE